MKVEKKVIGKLEKCYSLAPLHYQGKDHLLVAAEKQSPCLLFDLEGNQVATVWEAPGGTMSMVQIPGSDGQFLATHQFYSPNDSKEARIVLADPDGTGAWKIRTMAKLPFVHRFDILTRNGVNYIIACALKSGHECKDDWSMPGKVYAAVLPEDFNSVDEEHPLSFQVIKDQMLKNHGYYRITEDGVPSAVVSSDAGVFLFTPPETVDGDWQISKLLDVPASDAVLLDLDGDGEKELAVISPFHGEHISIYKKVQGSFAKVYEYGEPAEFSHAIYGGLLCGNPCVVIGHRQGKRNLILFRYNEEENTYTHEFIDEDCGSTNVYHYEYKGKDVLLSANRELDQIAMYTLE